MRNVAIGILALLPALFTGCLGEALPPFFLETTSVRYDYYGFPSNQPQALTLESGAGTRVFRVENAANVSFALTFDYPTDAFLAITFLSDHGDVFFPSWLSPPVAAQDGVSLTAGGTQQQVINQQGNEGTGQGGDFFFTTATAGSLVVAWAKMTTPAQLKLYWHEGTAVEDVAQSFHAEAASLHTFTGGVQVASRAITFSARNGFTAGQPEMVSLAVLTVHYPAAGAGSIKVRDSQSEDDLPLAGHSIGEKGRYIITREGPVTVETTAAGAEGLRVSVLVASVPLGLLPTNLTHEQRA